jgi:hypothetical protein
MGVTTDGTSLWVADTKKNAEKVFKYSVSGSLLGSWSIDGQSDNPQGITIDPTNVDTIWIVDSGTDQVFQYTGAAGRTSGGQSADATFDLATGNSNPRGIADPPAFQALPRHAVFASAGVVPAPASIVHDPALDAVAGQRALYERDHFGCDEHRQELEHYRVRRFSYVQAAASDLSRDGNGSDEVRDAAFAQLSDDLSDDWKHDWNDARRWRDSL